MRFLKITRSPIANPVVDRDANQSMKRIPSELILIVDDNPTNLKFLFGFLKESGFKVLVAADERSALEKIEQVLPDLILHYSCSNYLPP